MKKIKCESCAGTWIVEDTDLENQRVCPYCATSIYGEVEFSEYDSLDKAIYGAIQKMGKGILQNPRQLSGFLMDTAPALKKEIRIFSKTVNEDYIGYIKSAFEQEVEIAEATINKLHHLFVEEEGLSDSWADMICAGLHGAILYTKGVGTTRIVNVDVSDIQIHEDVLPLFPVTQEKTKEELPGLEKTDATPSSTPETYDILKHYKCPVCGYIIDGYDLKYGDSLKCPICAAERWQETDGELAGETDEEEYVPPAFRKPSNTYDSTAFKSVIENAKKYMANNDIEKAVECYRQMASGGYVPAFISIAEIYFQRKNYKKSWKWFLKAADAGDATGQYYVGYFYQEGLYVKKNTNQAVKYYEKAADQDNVDAILAIANCYHSGIGYPQNAQTALKYYTLAADKGNAEAQYRLGLFFQNGDSGTKDVIQAAEWYHKAHLQGHTKAKAKLDECIAEMPLTQRLKWNFQKK